MKALSEAIQRRRMSGAKVPDAQEPALPSAQQEGNASAQAAPTAESMLSMLPPEEKVKLFQMLKVELSEGAPSEEQGQEESLGEMQMEDETGELKTTPGEKQALSSESMDVASELADSRFSGDEKPRTLSDRVKINVANMLKKKGK